MTVVALAHFHGSFLAISDSRISWNAGGKLEKFSKLFSHRYNFTSGHPRSKPPICYIGELGLAFAGSTLFGLAFSNMFARAIAEMHSIDAAEPPTFGAFGKIANHCARILSQYVLGKNQCFEVLIFGFDPRTKDAKVIHLKLGPGTGGDGVHVGMSENAAREDEIISIGTGSKHLPKDLPLPSQVPLELLISKIVSSKVDPATGGDIQAMELRADCARFYGTIALGKSSEDATYYGINRADLGDIDGFRLGRSEPLPLAPYSAIRNLAQKKTRHLKDTIGNAPSDSGNVDPMMGFLSVIHLKKAGGVIDDNCRLAKAALVPGQYYFAKVCPFCSRNSPSILSPSEGEGFQGKLHGPGAVFTTCQYCDSSISFGPDDFQTEILWDGRDN